MRIKALGTSMFSPLRSEKAKYKDEKTR